MCFGGSQPQAPQVQYVGPSEDDIRRNEESLKVFEKQLTDQSNAFQAQLQQQIDNANAETAALKNQFADDLAAAESSGADQVNDAKAAGSNAIAGAGAEAATQTVGAYQVTASESEPLQPQTTQAVEKKKTPKKSLKISTAGTANTAGSGLNIGV